MNALFEKLDRLSSPLGSLLDVALDRLIPHTTASACGGKVLCKITCTGVCGNFGAPLKTLYYATSVSNCNRKIYSSRCPNLCC